MTEIDKDPPMTLPVQHAKDQPGEYTLGPLPWSREKLIQTFWANWVDSFEQIKEHPGFAAHQALEDIQTTLEIFLDGVDDLLPAVSVFRQE